MLWAKSNSRLSVTICRTSRSFSQVAISARLCSKKWVSIWDASTCFFSPMPLSSSWKLSCIRTRDSLSSFLKSSWAAAAFLAAASAAACIFLATPSISGVRRRPEATCRSNAWADRRVSSASMMTAFAEATYGLAFACSRSMSSHLFCSASASSRSSLATWCSRSARAFSDFRRSASSRLRISSNSSACCCSNSASFLSWLAISSFAARSASRCNAASLSAAASASCLDRSATPASTESAASSRAIRALSSAVGCSAVAVSASSFTMRKVRLHSSSIIGISLCPDNSNHCRSSLRISSMDRSNRKHRVLHISINSSLLKLSTPSHRIILSSRRSLVMWCRSCSATWECSPQVDRPNSLQILFRCSVGKLSIPNSSSNNLPKRSKSFVLGNKLSSSKIWS
mmetsp:Transcript_31562/g.75619  ORF Transcript_31562/g.75619 Transcript_31562/m.75619 type:complete len:399 (-) Transcript_31562:837-2033(-)